MSLAGTAWMDHAACRGAKGVMYPDYREDGRGPGKAGRIKIAKAKAVCAGCPVRAECLAHALETEELFGVWGGATPEERRAMRTVRPLAPVNCGTSRGALAHRRRGETPCAPCNQAWAAYMNDYRERRTG